MTRAPLAALLCVLATSTVAHADPRYALVIGMNDGRAPDGVPLPALRHAEREAHDVLDALVTHGRLAPERAELVTGGSRDDVLAATRRLRDRRAADRAELGDLPSLLVLYFTGHGRDGKLLTDGAPLTTADIEAIKAEVGATVLVAIFDTCESAGALPKGVIVGANPLDALGSHVLDAEGTVWIASASRGEVALEDQRGGIFTHHLVAAFTHAPGGQVGRSVTDLFEYARARTMRDVEALGHRQTPRIRLNLERTAPLYLSFHQDRLARLRFDPELGGTFLISYEDGTLLERLVKVPGRAAEVGAYPGRVRIYRAGEGAAVAMPWTEFRLASGQEAVITRGSLRSEARERRGVRSKGAVGVEVTLEDLPSPWRLGLGHRFDVAGATLLGTPLNWRLEAWLGRDDLELGAALAFGHGRSERYETWGYRAEQLELELTVSPGVPLGAFRLHGDLALAAQLHLQTFDDGADRTRAGAAARLGARLVFPAWGPVTLSLATGAGLRLAPGVAEGADDLGVQPLFYAGAAVDLRLP
ncbi:MAG: hypothetical protein CVU56_14750 [Deltaproteobacteria bacterium HGW-Deltaproteobacteria-14]|jgi:hypothetical protein|nr:MAG: hypothetical protein CVU56_14750 [Deltaproteobacteria bacterium HGW-Deltaproteobacteria-14]